jgi:hypothetical protein
MTDDKKVVELRPELATLKQAADEHRRYHHKCLFQQMAAEACVALAVKGKQTMGEVLLVLESCDKMAELILIRTEEIGKR